MTWTETHRRWQAVRAVTAHAEAGRSDELLWDEEYRSLFGSPEALLDALRYRLRLTRSAQLDTALPEPALAAQYDRVEAATRGIRALLASAARGELRLVPAATGGLRPGDPVGSASAG